MKVIVNKDLFEPDVEFFDPMGKSMGFLNELQAIDVRIQIVQNNLTGYSAEVDGEKIVINPDGNYNYNGLLEIFNKSLNMCINLIKCQKQKTRDSNEKKNNGR